MRDTSTTRHPGRGPQRSGAAGLLGWLLAPATDEVPRSHAVSATVVRVLLGLMWAYNVAWKRAPDFGQEAGNGLYKFTKYAVDYPVFPPYSWIVEHLVLPHISVFGWGVLAVETALAVLLLTGTYVRLACLLGIAESLAIGLSVAYAPHEWPWSYWLMIGAHLLLLVSSGGRVLAVDAVRAGLVDGRRLATVWGVGAALVGLYSVATSFGDPLAASGTGLRSSNLSMSLGNYNLLGGAVLVVCGVLLVLGGRGVTAAAASAAGLGLLAGLTLHAQLGFSDPILGGSPTSAAYFWSVSVVALALTLADRARRTTSSTPPSKASTP